MTKGEVAQKVGSEKVHLEALEREDWKPALWPPPPPPQKKKKKEEGQLGIFCGETSKEERSKKIRKWPITNVADIILVLAPKTTNGGNQWYTKNPEKVL